MSSYVMIRGFLVSVFVCLYPSAEYIDTVWHMSSIFGDADYNQKNIISLASEISEKSKRIIYNYELVNESESNTSIITTPTSQVKIIFFGDSLINKAQQMYNMLDKIASNLQQKHPILEFNILNKGVNGNKILDLRERMVEDVLAHNPDVVVMLWDSDASDLDEDLLSAKEVSSLRANYRNNLHYVFQTILNHGIQLFVSGPVLLGERPHGRNFEDDKVDTYRNINQEVCDELGISYINMRRYFFDNLPTSSADLLCGLPYFYTIKNIRSFIGLQTMLSCWLSKWMIKGFYRAISNTGRIMAEESRFYNTGQLTLDGEHWNADGAALGVKVFSSVLNHWLDTRERPHTAVLDNWSDMPGSIFFSPSRFPDPSTMVADLHDLGFDVVVTFRPWADTDSFLFSFGSAVGAWLLPPLSHTNTQIQSTNRRLRSKPFASAGVRSDDFIEPSVLRELTVSRDSALLDVTNLWAVTWLISYLKEAKSTLGVDGFYFTLGNETDQSTLNSFLSACSNRCFANSTALSQHGGYGRLFARIPTLPEASTLGSLYASPDVSGLHNDNNVGVLYPNLSPIWDGDTGVSALVSNTLLATSSYQSGTVYPGSLSVSSEEKYLKSELVIRWLQASLFFPLQMTMSPFTRIANDSIGHDIEDTYSTILYLRVQLEKTYRSGIVVGARGASGQPAVRGVWTASDPTGETAKNATLTSILRNSRDEYMAGSNVLVAPVLAPNATERRVVLPAGDWRECGSVASNWFWSGPLVMTLYKMTISTVPCFCRT